MTCRTADEAYAAGWDSGADDPPLTQQQAEQVAAILAPSSPQERAA